MTNGLPQGSGLQIVVILLLLLAAAFIFVNKPPGTLPGSPTATTKVPDPLNQTPSFQSADPAEAGPNRLDGLARNVLSGGPPKDGIPPIDAPRFVSVSDAENSLQDDDRVFFLDYQGVQKAFPQKILVWHEIVNDQAGGGKISVTYCPLTGTVIGFKGVVDGNPSTFGTSGKLVNSNLVMFDRATDSYWPQMLGAAISGPQKAKRLQQFPVVWSTWGKVKTQFPNAQVLSEDTGFIRSYGSDPYGSYRQTGNYYDSGGPLFPVMNEDRRLPDKEIVLGVMTEEKTAIPKNRIAEEKVVPFAAGKIAAVAFYDEALGATRAYSRGLSGQTLEFTLNDDGRIVDQNGAQWTPAGRSSDGRQLEWLPSYEAFWFAWAAYYPDTTLVA